MKKLGIAFLLAALAGAAVEASAEEQRPLSEFYGKVAKLSITHRVLKGTDGSAGVEVTDIIVFMLPLDGGKPIEFFFPETAGVDSSTGKPNAYQVDDETKKLLQTIKPNKDVYHITYDIQNKLHICQHIEAYKPSSAEDEPNVYVFVQMSTLKGSPAVDVTKCKVPVKFALPATKGPTGPVTDPKMAAASEKFKAGDIVEIETGPNGAIKTLALWEPPKMADLAAISKNEKGQTTIDVNGIVENKTLVVPSNKMSMLGKIRPLLSEKAKSKSVLYHAVADPKDPAVLLLKDIRPTPEGYIVPEIASKTAADMGGTVKDGVFWSSGKIKVPFSGEDVDFIEIHTLGATPQQVFTRKYLVTLKEAPAVMPKIAGMAQGTPVTFKFNESLQGAWLSDIKVRDASSRPAATAPAATQPAEEKKPA